MLIQKLWPEVLPSVLDINYLHLFFFLLNVFFFRTTDTLSIKKKKKLCRKQHTSSVARFYVCSPSVYQNCMVCTVCMGDDDYV